MPATAASIHVPDDLNKTQFKTKKPASNSSREIRDAILREHFGYTEADIGALRLQQDWLFYIREDNEEDWASVKQVMKWKTDPNGELSIPVPNRVVQDLIAFREQRASFEIFKVGMFITDTAIRDEVTKSLENILSKAGRKRIEALNNLMIAIEGSGASRYEIHRALRFLTNESGYRNNAFLLIAFARTTIYRSDTPSIVSNEIDQSKVASAIKAANESLYDTSVKTPLIKISETEAAAINNWASELYSKSNAEEKAIQRRWIERYLLMSDEERNSYKEGEIIEELPPDITVMQPRSPSQVRLEALNEKWQSRQEMEQKINRIGSQHPPTDHRNSEYFQTPADKLEIKDGLIP